MSIENKSNLPGRKESRDRRRASRDKILMFANYFDNISPEKHEEIEDVSWQIADEVTEQNDTREDWHGGVTFKRKLDRMLKRYLSGFCRDTELLMSDELRNEGDRQVAEASFQEADKHLSKFADLEYQPEEPNEEEESSEEDYSVESGSDSDKDDESQSDSPWKSHSRQDDNSESDEEYLQLSARQRVWRPAEKEEKPSIIGYNFTEDQEEISKRLEFLREEMADWEISTPEHFATAVDILVREHDVSVEDALKLVTDKSKLSPWKQRAVIRKAL